MCLPTPPSWFWLVTFLPLKCESLIPSIFSFKGLYMGGIQYFILCDLLLLLRGILVKFIYVVHVVVIHFFYCRELQYMHIPQLINSTFIVMLNNV